MTLEAELADFARAPRSLLFLDYDGTLVGIAPRPEDASPDEALLELLRRVASAPGREVHVVSGRKHEELEAFLGALPLWLHAEHGLFTRPPGGPWRRAPVSIDLARVRAAMDEAARALPGSFVEEKAAGLAFHYRLAAPPAGALDRLRATLAPLAEAAGGALLDGKAVVEVRAKGVDKGRIAREVLAAGGAPAILAAGDDTTDLDLFRALPPSAITVHVGAGADEARHRVAGPAELRALLGRLAGG